MGVVIMVESALKMTTYLLFYGLIGVTIIDVVLVIVILGLLIDNKK